jgi:hypothetical protein
MMIVFLEVHKRKSSGASRDASPLKKKPPQSEFDDEAKKSSKRDSDKSKKPSKRESDKSKKSSKRESDKAKKPSKRESDKAKKPSKRELVEDSKIDFASGFKSSSGKKWEPEHEEPELGVDDPFPGDFATYVTRRLVKSLPN